MGTLLGVEGVLGAGTLVEGRGAVVWQQTWARQKPYLSSALGEEKVHFELDFSSAKMNPCLGVPP